MCVVIRGAGRSDSSLGGFGALDPENQIVRVAYKSGRFETNHNAWERAIFILVLLATATLRFSLDRKRRIHYSCESEFVVFMISLATRPFSA